MSQYSIKKLLKNIIPEGYPEYRHSQLRQICETSRNIWFHLRKRTLTKRIVIVVGSGHRVGSSWLYRMLQDLTHCTPGIHQVPGQYQKFGTLRLQPDMYEYLSQLQGHQIFKSHSFPPDSEIFSNSAIFISTYRDPRDVLVSASFYIAYLDEEKGGWGEPFRKLSPGERVQALMTRSALFEELQQWFRTPFAYKVRYENLVNQPVEELEKIMDFIGIPMKTGEIKSVVVTHDFKKKTGRIPGEAKENSPMRKGIIGDWRNYFDAPCIETFKTYNRGQWNRLLVEMGYENSLNWT